MKKRNVMAGGAAAQGKALVRVQENRMKLLLVVLLLALSTATAFAQKSAVLDAFSKHGIDAGILNPGSLQMPKDHSYELTQTTITAGSEKVTVAQFDPSKPKEEQWTVVSIDGKSPYKSDINSFRKNQNKQAGTAQTDDATYKIEKETSAQLVISYKQNPAAGDKDGAFMKDCRMYMTINLKTKRLEQVQVLNEKPLKIKIVNAEKFDMVIRYAWNEQAKRYFSVRENLNMLVKFLGQGTEVQTISEYSNYSKR
jgi:hypothetical protein